MKVPEIKICGLTTLQDVRLIQKYKAEYAGIVMFYEKSRRNNTPENAERLVAELGAEILKTAVCVSPTAEQVQLIRRMGFDILQVHGELLPEVLACGLPVFRAFNIRGGAIEKIEHHERIVGYVLDGAVSGSGRTFDWRTLEGVDRDGKKLILAGGLTADNVQEGIRTLCPDVVDVSSYVEHRSGQGKDEEKIREFIERVRKNG